MFNLKEDEHEGPTGTYETFKAEGDILLRNCHFKKAIDSYTTALRLRPDDRISLVCRSQCYILLGEYSKALKDAEASLVEDKLYHRGMFQKAEALFNQGDFEMALVFYHRGHNVRPELDNFLLGIEKAREAICNCVGTPDRVKLNTTGDLSFFQPVDEQQKKVRNKGVLCTKKQQIFIKRVRPTVKRGNERTIKQMLGDLYGDRVYLEKLLAEIDDTTVTGNKVRSIAKAGLDYLDKRTEYWQQVRPVYAIKYEARSALNRMKASKISTHNYVLNELDKIDVLMSEGSYETALKRSQKVLAILDKYEESHLSTKMLFTAAVHSAIGSAFLELKDYVNAEKHHLLDLSIGQKCYIDEAECRALDNLGRVYLASGNFKKAIEHWERKLPMTKDPLETTWLCHELGRCYLSIGEFRKAKEYGNKSLAAAKDARDDRWQLHSLVLISQAEAKSSRLSSSLVTFEQARDIALLLKDARAETLIQKAIDGVNKKILNREAGIEAHVSIGDIFREPRK